MERFTITVSRDKEVFHFEVLDKHSDRCEFEVYHNGQLMATFEPNEEEYIKICRNMGGLDEEIIYMIADRIEAHHL